MRANILEKVNNYFDIIDDALDEKDYTRAQIYMAKLSKYVHVLDRELVDYYEYLTNALDGVGKQVEVLDDDFYYEPEDGC